MMGFPAVLQVAHLIGLPLADATLTIWLKELSFGTTLVIATYGFFRRVKNTVWPSVKALFN
jgi:hypothetical protein